MIGVRSSLCDVPAELDLALSQGLARLRRMFMELVRATKSEEVVFGKGFVPVLATYFAGTEEEFA